MATPEQDVISPRAELDSRISALFKLANSRYAYRFLKGIETSPLGNLTDDERREATEIVNSAITAIRGIGRVVKTGGRMNIDELVWERSLSDVPGPTPLVKFTVFLR